MVFGQKYNTPPPPPPPPLFLDLPLLSNVSNCKEIMLMVKLIIMNISTPKVYIGGFCTLKVTILQQIVFISEGDKLLTGRRFSQLRFNIQIGLLYSCPMKRGHFSTLNPWKLTSEYSGTPLFQSPEVRIPLELFQLKTPLYTVELLYSNP